MSTFFYYFTDVPGKCRYCTRKSTVTAWNHWRPFQYMFLCNYHAHQERSKVDEEYLTRGKYMEIIKRGMEYRCGHARDDDFRLRGGFANDCPRYAEYVWFSFAGNISSLFGDYGFPVGFTYLCAACYHDQAIMSALTG